MATKALMPYKEEDKDELLKLLGETRESVEENVKTIKNWLKLQPHLPEFLDDQAIENFLYLNKHSIEKTKQKIDNYYSIRNFIPELFSHHPLSPEMLEGYKIWYWLPLPKLINLDRIFIFKLADHNPEKVNTELIFSHLLNFAEIRLRYDCCYKDIYVFDLAGIKFAHLMRFSLPILYKNQIISEKVYSARVSALHVIVDGFETFLNKVKSVLTPKLQKRLHVHKNYESLYEFLPKEILPKDLGGEEKSLKELGELQLKCYEESKEMFDVTVQMKSNEELRPGKPVNDEFFGVYGNFRKIDVD